MKFIQIFILVTTLMLITAAKQPLGKINVSSTAIAVRQNSFFDWLNSIIQSIPPFNWIPTKPITTTTPKPTMKPESCSPCTCGTANTVKRIIGGQETKRNQYPWMAMLLYGGRFYCGGSLISELYVATAAHCLQGFSMERLSVRLMAHNLNDRSSRVIDRNVDKKLINEAYSSRTYDSDMGLLRLDKKVEMSDLLRPVCMPMAGNNYAGEESTITGWGATKEGGQVSNNLLEVKVPVLSQDECRSSNYGTSRITDNMLCAGVEEGGKDACQGDSGGPLHVQMTDFNTFHLAGITSWGEGCARKDYPGVYTRVTEFLDWIDENTGDSCKCDKPTKKLAQREIVIVE